MYIAIVAVKCYLFLEDLLVLIRTDCFEASGSSDVFSSRFPLNHWMPDPPVFLHIKVELSSWSFAGDTRSTCCFHWCCRGLHQPFNSWCENILLSSPLLLAWGLAYIFPSKMQERKLSLCWHFRNHLVVDFNLRFSSLRFGNLFMYFWPVTCCIWCHLAVYFAGHLMCLSEALSGNDVPLPKWADFIRGKQYKPQEGMINSGRQWCMGAATLDQLPGLTPMSGGAVIFYCFKLN